MSHGQVFPNNGGYGNLAMLIGIDQPDTVGQQPMGNDGYGQLPMGNGGYGQPPMGNGVQPPMGYGQPPAGQLNHYTPFGAQGNPPVSGNLTVPQINQIHRMLMQNLFGSPGKVRVLEDYDQYYREGIPHICENKPGIVTLPINSVQGDLLYSFCKNCRLILTNAWR